MDLIRECVLQQLQYEFSRRPLLSSVDVKFMHLEGAREVYWNNIIAVDVWHQENLTVLDILSLTAHAFRHHIQRHDDRWQELAVFFQRVSGYMTSQMLRYYSLHEIDARLYERRLGNLEVHELLDDEGLSVHRLYSLYQQGALLPFLMHLNSRLDLEPYATPPYSRE